MPVKPKPDNYHTVTPFLMVRGTDKLLDFLKKAFGAEEIERHTTPDGYIMHAEVKIGDSIIMMGDPGEKADPMPAAIYMYVDDTDSVHNRALEAGATSVREPADQFYGDRNAGVRDPFGNMWWISTHIEDVSREELNRRTQEFMKKNPVPKGS